MKQMKKKNKLGKLMIYAVWLQMLVVKNWILHADSSKLSYTTTQSDTMATILSGENLDDHFGVMHTPSVVTRNQLHQGLPAIKLWSF